MLLSRGLNFTHQGVRECPRSTCKATHSTMSASLTTTDTCLAGTAGVMFCLHRLRTHLHSFATVELPHSHCVVAVRGGDKLAARTDVGRDGGARTMVLAASMLELRDRMAVSPQSKGTRHGVGSLYRSRVMHTTASTHGTGGTGDTGGPDQTPGGQPLLPHDVRKPQSAHTQPLPCIRTPCVVRNVNRDTKSGRE